MPLQPLAHWMEIAVLETLLGTWPEHSGSRDQAYAVLDREFRSAMGPDYDISAFQSLDAARSLESQYLSKYKLKKDTQTRTNFKRKLKVLRREWNATQSMGLRDDQCMLEFQSLAQE
jgi:hypothetical protein